MVKCTRFQDIPQFVHPHYAIDVPLDYLETILERFSDKHNPLKMCPDFQRGHVWSGAQQIAFVEYFLKGGISGRDIFFNHPGWMKDFVGDFVLVDGLQRLTAALRFLRNEIPAFGSLRCEYTDNIQATRSFKFHVASLKTRAEVLQWYIDLNEGGTPHADAEIERVRGLLELERRAA